MYHPVIKDHFSDCLAIHPETGALEIEKSQWAQKKLALCVNDNVYKNLEGMKVASFDKKSLVHQDAFTVEEKTKLIDEIFEKSESQEQVGEWMDSSVDKILVAHRNTKIFLFMLTGPFLVILQFVK